MDYTEKTKYINSQFKGDFIEIETIRVELPDGNEANRDVIRHPGAAVIIAIDKEKKIFLVRQFRKAIERELLELPAGKLDGKGEDPLECAKRELKEETGLTSNKIRFLTSIYSAPGIMDEELFFYLAEDLVEGELQLDEGEFLHVEKYLLSELLDFVLKGEIRDSKTIVGILFIEKYFAGML